MCVNKDRHTWREFCQAVVVGVVHEVVDGVNAASSASVTTSRAAKGWVRFRRCVCNLVSAAGAATLECVVESNPVAGFMSESLSRVEVSWI